MATLEIRLLGGFSMLYNGAPRNGLGGARAQSLLAYLLLHRDAPVSRQRLAFLFWPDSSEAQARANLRGLLHALLQALPESDRLLQSDGQTVQWREDGPFTLDMDTFRAAARQANSAPELRDALAFYAGELLPECYDDWVVPERERLAEEYRNLLQRLVDLLEQQREFQEAIVQAQSLVRHDPLREQVWRQMLRLHALNGDRAGVARAYRECKAVLKRELDVEPSAETEAAYARWKRYGEPVSAKVEPPGQTATSRLPAGAGSSSGNEDPLAGVERAEPGYAPRNEPAHGRALPWIEYARPASWRRVFVWRGLNSLARVVSVGILVLLAGVLAYTIIRQNTGLVPPPPAVPTQPPLLKVKGCMGGSKEGLLKDPDVQRILLERYNLRVSYEKMGSGDMVERCSAGYDFVWPGTEADVVRFKQKLGPNLTYETPLSSALVLYSWAEITDVLLKQGVIAQDANGVYSVADEAHTLEMLRWLTEGKEFGDLGLPGIRGHFRIVPTDPAKSESGGIFAVYLTGMLLGGDVPDMAAAQQAMPQVRRYFDGLGYLEPSTGQLFARFLKAGAGDKPIIAAYESQGIETIKQYPDAAKILEKMRIIYPRPTVWVSHPLIALTSGGKALIQALNDKEIQDIAWKKHGFRSGVAGVTNDPQELLPARVPAEIRSTLDLPQPAVIDWIVDQLSQ